MYFEQRIEIYRRNSVLVGEGANTSVDGTVNNVEIAMRDIMSRGHGRNGSVE